LRVLSFLIAGLAWAEDPPSTPEVYEVRASRDERHPGATLSTVDLEDRADEQTSVAEVLDELPGLQLRSIGGLGSYTSLSIRGSSASQTAIYLDGVPMNRGALAPVDLSTFAVEGLERIDVCRGLPPPDRMGAGLGGVVDLVTRREPGGEARASGGSFGTRGALLRGGQRYGRAFFSGTASYLGSEGDFAYLDHNGTLNEPSDDAWVTRTNNDFDQADLVAHASHEGFLSARATQNVFYKEQGLAGPLTIMTERPDFRTARSVTRLDVGRTGVIEGAADLSYQADHYRDPDNEIGLGAQDQRGRTWAGGGELRATFPMGTTALVVLPQVHYEHYDQDDALAQMGAGDLEARRIVVGGAVFDVISLRRGRLVLEPAVRVDHYADEADGVDETRLLLSPRAGGRITLRPDLDVRSSAGSYHRAPTFLESFGDQGILTGNPDLRPERGVAVDSGIIWRGPVRVETSFHYARVTDFIVFIQNSQLTLRAQNVGRARLMGAEAAISARPWRRLQAQVSYAFLSATNLQDGRRLPGRAQHEAYARLDLDLFRAGAARLSLFGDVEASAGTYLDAGNLRPLPPRAFVGAGVKLAPPRPRGLSFTVEGKNLANTRTETVEIRPSGRRATVAIQDYTGYALPGRAFYATARMTF